MQRPLNKGIRAVLGAVVVLTAAIMGMALAAEPFPVPDHSHKCPVCGMLVHRYPDFLASVTYADGQTVFFDGAKDMFKYLFNLAHYAPERRTDRIEVLRVTEYYDMTPMDGRQAFFVVGSDVLGPMGHELIPLRSEADALAFKADHKGRRVLAYPQVTPATINRLD